MQAYISAKFLGSKDAQAKDKPFEVYDERLTGFMLRVQPSGKRSYYVRLGANRRIALGTESAYKPDEARERCGKVLGNVAHGRPPLEGLDGTEGITLGDFLKDTYSPWALARRPRTAQKTLDRIMKHFANWYARSLKDITLRDVESHQTKRLNDGTAAATVQRDLDTLSSVLTRAMKLKLITENVVRQVERPRQDRNPKVRFLGAEEERRLRKALTDRDIEMREKRDSHNRWLQERMHDLMPPLPHYGDHVTPAVILSINTGMRRGELLSLRWASVDMKGKQLTIEGGTAKNKQTRHIPLNTEALAVLEKWKEQAPTGDRVFPISTGFKSAWAPLLVRARVTSFRWHDLRHHFASRLAQAGVPLNTIRELLGHGSMAMTLRYAHLAPDQRADAVAKLVAP